MAKGRCISGVKDGFELRESQSGYNAIFDPENRDIASEWPDLLVHLIWLQVVSLARPRYQLKN